MTSVDLLDDLYKQIISGSKNANTQQHTRTHRMGGSGEWMVKRRASKRSARGTWVIDKDGTRDAQIMECGFFFIKRKRLTIYRDAQCDGTFQKRKDKLIGSRKGSPARAGSLAGNRGPLNIMAYTSSTNKGGKTRSDTNYEMTFFDDYNPNLQKISTPINEAYLRNTGYISEGGLTVNQIKAMTSNSFI